MSSVDAVLAVARLDPDAIRYVLSDGVAGLRLGLVVVVAAAFSAALGQSVALFAIGVRPSRFVVSLALQAALLAVAVLAWTASAWALGRYGFGAPVTFAATFTAVGVAHAPQVLAAFALVPFFGSGIAALLATWTLLAAVVATGVAADLGLAQAASAAAGGWLLVQVLQRTVGRPLTGLVRYVRVRVAGADARGPHPEWRR